MEGLFSGNLRDRLGRKLQSRLEGVLQRVICWKLWIIALKREGVRQEELEGR